MELFLLTELFPENRKCFHGYESLRSTYQEILIPFSSLPLYYRIKLVVSRLPKLAEIVAKEKTIIDLWIANWRPFLTFLESSSFFGKFRLHPLDSCN